MEKVELATASSDSSLGFKLGIMVVSVLLGTRSTAFYYARLGPKHTIWHAAIVGPHSGWHHADIAALLADKPENTKGSNMAIPKGRVTADQTAQAEGKAPRIT